MIAALPLGTIPAWLTFVGAFAICWILYRGGSPTAVSGLQDTNRELERQVKERDGKVSALERINAELRASKDVTVAITPVLEAMQTHERRAEERHQGMLNIANLIAERLGPDDPNGH
jgi:hypothetical protein